MVWAEIIHTFYLISKGETVDLLFLKMEKGVSSSLISAYCNCI